MGWTLNVRDLDVDAAEELVTELATTYAQLAAEDNIEVLSASASDITQTVTVTGINNKGKRVSEDFTLIGTGIATGSTLFLYIDQAEVDIECVGAVTVRREAGDTFITSIPINYLEAGMAQHFNGEKDSYVTGWKIDKMAADATFRADLRWYPDDADCLDPTDGMVTKDTLFIEVEDGGAETTFAQPIRLKAGGWLAVYGKGGAANTQANVTVTGYDVRP